MNILYSLLLFISFLFTNSTTYQGYDIGDLATDFKLENIDGTTRSQSGRIFETETLPELELGERDQQP